MNYIKSKNKDKHTMKMTRLYERKHKMNHMFAALEWVRLNYLGPYAETR